MREVFYHLWEFNSDLSQWDTSSVETMRYMFYEMPKFNSDISGWDTSRVTSFEEMFYGATEFNQDLSGWDLSAGECWDKCIDWSTSQRGIRIRIVPFRF